MAIRSLFQLDEFGKSLEGGWRIEYGDSPSMRGPVDLLKDAFGNPQLTHVWEERDEEGRPRRSRGRAVYRVLLCAYGNPDPMIRVEVRFG